MTKGYLVFLIVTVLAVAIAGCVGQGISKESILANATAAMINCAGAPADQKDDCFMLISDTLRTVNVTASYDACMGVSDDPNSQNTPRSGCIQSLLQSQNDTDVKLGICRMIDRDDLKQNCIDRLVEGVSNQTRKIEICNEIDDVNFRNHCYGPMNEGSSDLSLDTKLQLCAARSDKDNCYRDLAQGLFEADPATGADVCNKITDSNARSNCLSNFLSSPELVKANPDLAESICDSFSILTKSRCYSDIARTLSASDPKRAAGICQKLGDDIQISDCYNNAWFYSNSLVLENYDFTVGLCNVLTLKKDDCLNRIVGVFIDVDRAKAEATCKLMSAASSSSCVNGVRR